MHRVEKRIDELDNDEINQIIALHQKTFNLHSSQIKDFMLEREQIILIKNNEDQKIIGTIGIQTVLIEKTACLYVGNTVIEKKYRKSGVLSKYMLLEFIKFIKNNIRKEKYICFFCTTPMMFDYFIKFKYSWPKPGSTMPNSVYNLSKNFVEQYDKKNISEPERGIFLLNFTQSTSNSNHIYTHEKNNVKHAYYSYITNNDLGNQLFCIGKINMYTLLQTLFMSIRRKKKV